MSINWKIRYVIKYNIYCIHTSPTITQKYAQWSQVNMQKPMDTLESVQHHKKVEHIFFGL